LKKGVRKEGQRKEVLIPLLTIQEKKEGGR